LEVEVHRDCTGVEDLAMQRIKLYFQPNPANQWVSVHYTLPLNEKEALLTIMDAQGRQLRSITVTGTEGQKLIDLRDLDAGLYLYTLTTKSLTKSGKLIISR
ncbi:MAG: T9SS type A sorting domain-containing protein, partial [Sphingobacteriia bacterium]|nr:T9SS type A sorting domain-containing protein [Sphingobacteriia bacterium]